MEALRAEVGDLDAIALDRVIALRDRIAVEAYNPDPRSVAYSFLREVVANLLA